MPRFDPRNRAPSTKQTHSSPMPSSTAQTSQACASKVFLSQSPFSRFNLATRTLFLLSSSPPSKRFNGYVYYNLLSPTRAQFACLFQTQKRARVLCVLCQQLLWRHTLCGLSIPSADVALSYLLSVFVLSLVQPSCLACACVCVWDFCIACVLCVSVGFYFGPCHHWDTVLGCKLLSFCSSPLRAAIKTWF